ncbi:MAG TPA: TadE/TadG family type IV pilus assembly protein, partial [Rhizomicrobium sp.]|nr:TadE/TadG family type IV pilus assembly protein [Rhizomicrobium sp.]
MRRADRFGVSWLREMLNLAAQDGRGIAATEFAILVPVLVLLAVCTADLGLAIYSEMQVQNSAEAGVGYA